MAVAAALAAVLGGSPTIGASGVAWTTQGLPWSQAGPSTASLASISCPAAGSCIAVGSWTNASGSAAPMAETLASGTWTPDGLGLPSGATDAYLSGISCVSATSCVAVGEAESSSGERPLVGILASGSWSLSDLSAPSGSDTADLSAVSCTGATACVAVGRYSAETVSSGFFHTHVLVEALSGSTWASTTGIDPSGTESSWLVGISCTSSSACTGIGTYDHTTTAGPTEQPLVETLSGGSWSHQVLSIPSGGELIATMSGISCTATTACVAVGEADTSTNSRPAVVVETLSGSTWTGATVSGSSSAPYYPDLQGVSCTSTTSCVAVGESETGTTGETEHILLETLSGTTWSPSTPADPSGTSDVALSGVSCVSSSCEAAGAYAGGDHVLAASISGSTVTGTTGIDPTGPAAAQLQATSCADATHCVAVGYTELAADGFNDVPFVSVLAGGIWTSSSLGLPNGATAAQLYGVSCTAATACVAVGYYETSSNAYHALVETLSGSTWTATELPDPASSNTPQLYGVSCTGATACVAVGYEGSSTGGPLVETLSGGSWTAGSLSKPAGATTGSYLTAVSCTATTACTAVGTYRAKTYLGHPLVESLSGSTWTATEPGDPAGTSATTSASLTAVSCTAATTCTATGTSNVTSATSHGFAETGSGSSWTEATLPSPGGSTSVAMGYGMSCTTTGTAACVAVGNYTTSGRVEHSLVETYSSGSWSATAPTDPSGAIQAQLFGASCTSDTQCTAVGQYQPAAGGFLPLVADLAPPPATHFSVTIASSATAGSPVSVTVKALDAAGDVATGFTGTVDFTSTDAQAGLPSGYTFTATDGGVHTFTGGVTFKTAGEQTVTATESGDSSVKGTSGTVTVAPAAASTLVVSAPANATALTPASFTVTAKDPYGNTATGYRGQISFSSTDTSATLPPDYTFGAGTAGTHTFTGGVTFVTQGEQKITATDTADSSVKGTSGTVDVAPAPATHFTVTATAAATAGTPITVTVTALDARNGVVTGYTGTVHLTSTDPQASLPANHTFGAGTDGTHTFTDEVTLKTAGEEKVTATDTSDSSVKGTSGTVDVAPAAASTLAVTATATATAGSPITVAVTAKDPYGNVATGYTGTVTFSSTDTGSTVVLPGNHTFAAGTDGTHTFTGGVTLVTAGEQKVTATDTTTHSITGTSGTVDVAPAGASALTVAAPPTATAGTPISVTVTAKDRYGNVATGYTGTVTFSSTDTGAGVVLPANHTFTAGTDGAHTFTGGVTLVTAGEQEVTATDTAVGSITGTSSTVTVAPAAASSLTVTTTTTATAGTPIDVTVTAKDRYGNVATGYTGTVTFSSTDTGSTVVLPADYTFGAGTDGTHTFTGGVTLVTAGNQRVRITDTGTASITGASGMVDVAPAAASTLRVTAPSSATAGSPIDVTVTAYDPYGNIATGYRGTVHFTSTDTGATVVLPADHAFSGTTAGTHTFAGGATLVTAGERKVTAADTVTAAITGTSGTVAVAPAAASTLRVTGLPASATAGSPVSMTVTAYDPYGNIATGYTGTVHVTSTDGQAALPADYPFQAATAGTHTFAGGVTLKTAGEQKVTATDTTTSSITGTSGTVDVAPAGASTLRVAAPLSATAGSPISVTVTAYDPYGNVATGYTGTVKLTSTDPQAVLPASYPFQAGTAGTHTFAGGVTLKTAGEQKVTATDTTTSSITGTSGTVDVAPAGASRLGLMATATATAGTPIDVTVTAYDPYGNVATGYTGTVHVTSTDVQAALPGNYTFSLTTEGVHTYSGKVTLKTAGEQKVTATDTTTSSITGTSGTVTVSPAATSALKVSATAGATAGTPFTVTVTAVDPYGNVTPAYRGTVHFTSTDAKAGVVLPADYAFVGATAGTHRFTGGTTLVTAGEQKITATDTTTHSITGTSGTVDVSPAAASTLRVTAPTTAVAGTPIDVTVTAYDPYGNVATGYTGTVHFTSTDSGATVVLPADYAFTADDAGAHTFTGGVTLVTAGEQTVTATDTAAGSITGTSGTVTVAPAAASRLAVTVPTGTTAGTAVTVTVTAYDPYGNVATGYTGTVHFTSTDPQAVLPADYAFAGTTAGTHSFTGGVTLKTAGGQTVTATDATTAAVTGTSGTVDVSPAATTTLTVQGPATAVPGTPVSLTVTAVDPYGNVAAGYAGTVHFTTSDDGTGVVLPADYTFTAGDAGVHVFVGELTLVTAGRQTVTATDTTDATVTGTSAPITVGPAPTSGYYLFARDGGVFAYGDAQYDGSMGGQHLNRPVVGMATTPDGGGYWLVASDGGVFAFGDAQFYGSMGGRPLNQPVVGMAATPDGRGYWLVASDGGIFAFGDAGYYGSMGGQHLDKPVVGLAATPDGRGYWLVASDGGIFAFGDAPFYGSMGGQHLAAPVVGIAASPDGRGYWLVAADGGIFAFGDAGYYGSMGGQHLDKPVVGLAPSPDGQGYWEVASDGGVFAFGDAPFYGSAEGQHLNRSMAGIAT